MWVLIAFLTAGYAGGPIAVEFRSEAACIQAMETIKAQHHGLRFGDWAICTPKHKDIPNG